MNNLPYLLALHSVEGLGPLRLKAVLDYFVDPQIAWEADNGELIKIGIPKVVVTNLQNTRKTLDPHEYAAKIEKSGVGVVTLFDSDYPESLKQIYNPPIILYHKGGILAEDKNAIAVVGTRKVTGYGRLVTEKLVRELVGVGLTIVSGLARGVDTIAHLTTIANHGRTIAVLGGGLNKVFPPENAKLADKIANGYGAIISEYPPDYPSLSGNFPSRNRIIAGLSIATLVTEAAIDSGSLITARAALELGKEVFAVPGPVTSQLSLGPIDLIKSGAKPVTDVEDILEELGVHLLPKKSQDDLLSNLSDMERQILEKLERESMHLDELGRELRLSSAQVSGALLRLEIAGLAVSLGGGIYSKS